MKATLSKVELGEADAAIVYVTDVASSGKVDGVEIPDDVNVVTTLPIVALKDSKNAALAQAWVDFVVAHKSGARRQVRVPSAVTLAPATARGGQPTARPRRRRRGSSASLRLLRPAARRLAVARAVERRRLGARRPRRPRGAAPVARLLACRRPALSVLFGLPIAWLLARSDFAGPRPGARPGAAAARAAARRRRRRAASTRSAAAASSASGSTAGSTSGCRSRCGPRSSPRPSWRCRSSSSRSKARCAGSTPATRTRPRPTGPAAGP